MAGVFDNSPEDGDEDQSPGIRVAGTMTGDGEDAPEEAPQAEQPQGMVDNSAQSYLSPAEADEPTGDMEQSAAGGDSPVSADTKAYMTPIAPPTLSSPKAFADHSADYGAMATQKQAESQQDVKSSGWRKAGAILAGIGTLNVRRGYQTAEDIMNQPRVNAQKDWAMQEAPIQSRITADQAADAAVTRANATTEQSNRTAESNYRNQILGQQDAARAENYQAQAEARRNAITAFTPDDPANPYAGGTGTTADGRIQKGIAPPDSWIQRWVKTPQGQLATQQMTLKQRAAAADQIGLEGTNREYFLANGKLAQPTEHTSVNLREGGANTPTPLGAMGPGEIIAQNMSDKQAYVDSLARLDPETMQPSPNGNLYDKAGNPVSDQQFKDRLEKFRTDLNANPVMRKSGTMVDSQGNTVTNRFSRNPSTAATPPQSSPSSAPAAAPAPVYKAKSGANVTVGTRVVVNGRTGTVASFDAKGKPVVKY